MRQLPPMVRATWGVLGAGVLASWGLMLSAGSLASPTWWIAAVPLGVWMAVPFGVIALASRWMSGSAPARWVNLVAAILLSAIVVWVMIAAFVLAKESPSPAMLIYLAFYQGVAYLPFLLLAIALQRRRVTEGRGGSASPRSPDA